MKKTFLLLLAAFVALTASAQTAREEIMANIRLSASNYIAYPEPTATLTPAPKGYKPVYISHYARHGSRWHTSTSSYTKPLKTLQKAADLGKLTPDGLKALAVLKDISRQAEGRAGELTAKGARQHRGIADRMYKNFPEVFRDGAHIDARSTVVIRCILSMMNECLQLQQHNKTLQITSDASAHDMYYMNDEYNAEVGKYAKSKAADSVVSAFYYKHVHPEALMTRLFNDPVYVKDSVNQYSLMGRLFSVASNMQSHDTELDLYYLFTPEELYQMWRYENLSWYHSLGPSALKQGMMPYYEKNLLRNILTTADSCLQLDVPGATLRFGHEVVVLPLACLMELDGAGKQYADPETLEEYWRNYKIFPMGCNIQLIFYRKKGSDDVLVKALLNEHEATLPVSSDVKPYYHWKDVREYYDQKLKAFK